jgi:hypothetical protein
MERAGPQIITVKIMIGNSNDNKGFYIGVVISKEKSYRLFALLAAWRRCLILRFFSQSLFQAALTITMHFGLIAVLTKVFGYIVFVGIILRYYYHLVKGLQQYTCKCQYSYNLFQSFLNTLVSKQRYEVLMQFP